MTPHALSEPSCLGHVKLTALSERDLFRLDPETHDLVREAAEQTLSDFVNYAHAYGTGTIAEFLIDNPDLAVLGKVLLGGKGNGLIAVSGNLNLCFTFERHGLVLQFFWFTCHG